MSGIEESKIPETKAGFISIDIACFMRWFEDNHNRMFSWEEVQLIIQQFLKVENIKHNQKDIDIISLLCFSTSLDSIDKVRVDTKWDERVDGFLSHFGILIENDGKLTFS